MADLIGSLLVGSGALFMVAGYVAFLMLFLWWPFMAFSATRNIKKIRIQLERLNDTLEARAMIDSPPASTRLEPVTARRSTELGDAPAIGLPSLR